MWTNALKSRSTARSPTAAAPIEVPRRATAVRAVLRGTRIQPKLRIGAVNDPAEAEADQVAERVMRMPRRTVIADKADAPPLAPRGGTAALPILVSPAGSGVQRLCADCEDELHRKAGEPAQFHGGSATPAMESAVGSLGGGMPLPASECAFFEPRFGRSFDNVRIHTGGGAHAAARAINARAFTLGSDVAFAAGEYAPGTDAGHRLLAHELVHVVQQGEGAQRLAQRAEVDDRPFICAPLTDIASDVNTMVRTEITAARASAGIAPGTVPPRAMLQHFVIDVRDRLGGNAPVSPIESFVEALPSSKRFLPGTGATALAGTRFAGAESANRFYLLQTLGAAHVVGSTVKINGICVGADKLGHFFQQGFDYAVIAGSTHSVPTAESAGRASEIGIFGLTATGVYSNADLAANLAGLSFYADLAGSPATLTFDIAHYIAPAWNEQTNPSFYTSDIANVVWRNVLNGGWAGAVSDTASLSSNTVMVDLAVPNATTLSGRYEYDTPGGAVPGTIAAGAISQQTTTVSGVSGTPSSATPVSGVAIDFDWWEGVRTGKGHLESLGENQLRGTWGWGASRTGRGDLQLVKT